MKLIFLLFVSLCFTMSAFADADIPKGFDFLNASESVVVDTVVQNELTALKISKSVTVTDGIEYKIPWDFRPNNDELIARALLVLAINTTYEVGRDT